ncbi:hypothetical protein FA95DRAFT_1608884 [Auriscalpium vulgare]|uniref:Uncharacterized protein n=1 Tax=Auriscalpium vulgare TaxID=40419 RepID=A0ACB8RII0_9AGAM|nr:hypothetical protein FA95DRAFT_1608884 [Auriscalpium vulgare]
MPVAAQRLRQACLGGEVIKQSVLTSHDGKEVKIVTKACPGLRINATARPSIKSQPSLIVKRIVMQSSQSVTLPPNSVLQARYDTCTFSLSNELTTLYDFPYQNFGNWGLEAIESCTGTSPPVGTAATCSPLATCFSWFIEVFGPASS